MYVLERAHHTKQTKSTSKLAWCGLENDEHLENQHGVPRAYVPRVTKYSTMPLCPSRPVGGFPEVPNRRTLRIVLHHEIKGVAEGAEIIRAENPASRGLPDGRDCRPWIF